MRNLFNRYEEEIRNGLKDISKGSRTSEKQMNELFYCFLYCLQPAIRNKIKIFSLKLKIYNKANNIKKSKKTIYKKIKN